MVGEAVWVGWYENELPAHEVTLSQGFYLGKYELTQGQWESVMGTTPWSGQENVQERASNPAVYISWEDMQGFISALNEGEGAEVYRLPTEAEWEYACRAGTTTQWSFGDAERPLGDYAWYEANIWDVGEPYAHPVGMKLPNPWGLYDMYGNVSEWCQDRYSGTYYSESPGEDPPGSASGSVRVLRGGHFYNYAWYARSASRFNATPDYRYHDAGARLVRQEL
jgi:formylglycine-generating enzyme required for sulfatase activity